MLAMPAPDADVVNRAQAMNLTPRINLAALASGGRAPRAKRALIMLSVASLLLAFGALASGETADALLRRYPYDPACPWGRIGNGKGLIVRCLSESEAQALRTGALPAVAAGTPTTPSVAPPAAVASVAAPTPAAEVVEADAGAPTPPTGSDEKLEVTVGPVTADSGTLGIGKLGAARDRYVKCVKDNGGLSEKEGEVQVRFLLRQRGRAEGVSVAKRSGVSAEAARCISDIVDRRYVGVPEAPIVGATVVIKFAKASK